MRSSFGPELERDERVEVRAAPDLARDRAEEGEVRAMRDAAEAHQAVGDLDEAAEGVAQHEERLVGRVLRELVAHELAALLVLGEHRLEIAREDVGAILRAEQLTRLRDRLLERVAHDAQLVSEVVGRRRASCAAGPRGFAGCRNTRTT
jgi:hypothetical protein